MWSGNDVELLSYHDGCVPHVHVHVHVQYMKHSSGFGSLWWFYHPGHARHCWLWVEAYSYVALFCYPWWATVCSNCSSDVTETRHYGSLKARQCARQVMRNIISCWWGLTSSKQYCPGTAGLSGPTITVFIQLTGRILKEGPVNHAISVLSLLVHE